MKIKDELTDIIEIPKEVSVTTLIKIEEYAAATGSSIAYMLALRNIHEDFTLAKSAEDWKECFELFESKPTNTSWNDHVKNSKRRS